MIQKCSSFIGKAQKRENEKKPISHSWVLVGCLKLWGISWEKNTLDASSFQTSVRNLKVYLSWFTAETLLVTRSRAVVWNPAQKAAEGRLQTQNMLVSCQSFLIIPILMLCTLSCLSCCKSFLHSPRFSWLFEACMSSAVVGLWPLTLTSFSTNDLRISAEVLHHVR